MNNLEARYNQYKTLEELFYKADEAGDENGKTFIRNYLNDFYEGMDDRFKTALSMHKDNRDRGNEYFHLPYYDKDIVSDLKSWGVEKFTIYESASAKTIAKFLQDGCKIDGVIERIGHAYDWYTKDYEKEICFLLSIQ